MNTVPAAMAAFLLAEHPERRRALRECGRVVGTRVEVDLDAVRWRDPQAAAACEHYMQRNQEMWRALAAGTARPYVQTRRTLARHRQSTTKGAKTDLREVFAELQSFEPLASLLETSTGPQQTSRQELRALGADHVALAADSTLLRVDLEPHQLLPDSLGGAPTYSEVGRHITVTARHAPWRDRRVRRLAAVDVEVTEIWAPAEESRAMLQAPWRAFGDVLVTPRDDDGPQQLTLF